LPEWKRTARLKLPPFQPKLPRGKLQKLCKLNRFWADRISFQEASVGSNA
jgi:hypothetical protein